VTPTPSREPSRSQPGRLRPVLEESPQLRMHAVERARTVRRVVVTLLSVVLIALAAWATWSLVAVRDFGVSARQPLEDDKATRLLDAEGSDLTLVVVRNGAAVPVVGVFRKAKGASGSWLLGVPDVPLVSPGQAAAISASETLGSAGRAGLLQAVSVLAGVPFAHYVEVDARVLATALGERPDAAAEDSASVEPSATPEARDLASASRVRAALTTLAESGKTYSKIASRPLAGVSAPRLAGLLRGHVVSDLSAGELAAVLGRLGSDARSGKLAVAVVPSEQVDRALVVSASAGRTLVARMRAGKAFGKVALVSKPLVPSSVSVTIQNGAGENGVASEASRILTREGYRVRSVGNANQFVYDKTLVVYEEDRRRAESVAEHLAIGKVVASRGMYSFATDVLVIVGKDWPDAP
jgi:hypothetical protein